MKKDIIIPEVRNLVIHQSFLIYSREEKTVIPVFEVPPEWYFEIHTINIVSTLYYERCLAGDITDTYKSSEIAFYLADAGEKIIPNVVIMPTAQDVEFNPPLLFQRELNLIIAPYIRTFRKKEEITLPLLPPPELQKVPFMPFPYRVESRIYGILRTK